MPFVCGFVCGTTHKKKKRKLVKNNMFRRADPNFVNFVPKTCEEAIDLFTRHRRLGLTADLYPECFVHCARKLPDAELDKFHRFIVTPVDDFDKGGEKPTLVDKQLEEERQQLLKEAEARDKGNETITEEPSCIPDPKQLEMPKMRRQVASYSAQDDGELADDGDQDDEKTAEAELATEDEFTVIEQTLP